MPSEVPPSNSKKDRPKFINSVKQLLSIRRRIRTVSDSPTREEAEKRIKDFCDDKKNIYDADKVFGCAEFIKDLHPATARTYCSWVLNNLDENHEGAKRLLGELDKKS
jgi:hypothetical protein